MPGYEKEGQSPANLEALIQKVLSDREDQKKQAKKIDNMENNLRVIGNLICDESGKCRLATKEDLAKVEKWLLFFVMIRVVDWFLIRKSTEPIKTARQKAKRSLG